MKKILIILFIAWATLSSQAQSPQYETHRILQGSDAEIENIRFSPDGKYIAAASHDHRIYVWLTATGQLIHTLTAHTDKVTEITFSPDGRMLASASMDGTAKIWDSRTGNLRVNYINPAHPEQIRKGQTQAEVTFVAFTQDARYLFFGGSNSAVMRVLINQYARGATMEATKFFWPEDEWLGWITGGTITSDGSMLAFSMSSEIVTINLSNKAIHRLMNYYDQFFNDISLGPEPNTISAWTDQGIVVTWSDKTGEELQTINVLRNEPKEYSSVVYSPDGQYMATGVSGTNAHIWNVAIRNPKIVATLQGHTKLVRVCRFSPTEELVATASYDGTVRLWGPPKPKEAPNPTPKSIDESKLAAGSSITLDNIHFQRGKAILEPDSYPTLDEVVDLMKRHPNMTIELQGHTDYLGSYIQNFQLSKDRVSATKAYLEEHGIESSRVSTKAFGGTEPIKRSDDAQERTVNRRVEMIVLTF